MSRVVGRALFLTLVLVCAGVCAAGVSNAVEASAGPGTAPAGGSSAPANPSTPAETVRAFWAALWAGDPSALRAVTTNGSDDDYRLCQASSIYAHSADGLYRAAIAKFGAAAKATALCTPGVADRPNKTTPLETKIEGETATVLVRGDTKRPIELTRRDGVWRVDLARMRGRNPRSPQAAQIKAIARIMDRTGGEIADGQYATAPDAVTALFAAIKAVYEPLPNDLALAREAPSTRPAVDSPPTSPVAGYDPKAVDAHRQKYDMSCIPMSVELVLKLLGREAADYYALQEPWKNKADGNLVDFDGRTIAGVTFRQQFDDLRGNDFPTEDLFNAIDSELEQNRYAIIALNTGSSYHMYVIVGRTPSGDYHAVSKAGDATITVTNVKARVREMKGTDILTYVIGDAKQAAEQTGGAVPNPNRE